MFHIEKIKFMRSIRPEDSIRNPILVLFSDASTEAFGARAYVRWETKGGQFICTLLLDWIVASSSEEVFVCFFCSI